MSEDYPSLGSGRAASASCGSRACGSSRTGCNAGARAVGLREGHGCEEYRSYSIDSPINNSNFLTVFTLVVSSRNDMLGTKRCLAQGQAKLA